jgi:hypothetical protein
MSNKPQKEIGMRYDKMTIKLQEVLQEAYAFVLQYKPIS